MNSVKIQSAPKFDFFKKESNELRFLFVLGKVHYKFADIGELLAIKNSVNEDDASSFIRSYLEFAEKCENIADDCFAKGHMVSASDGYLRASTYYYAAMDYLDEAM